MKRRTLISLSIAAALALPLTAQAGGDKAASNASQGSSASGAEAMFKSLDKNHDGKLSRAEHAAAPEHASDKAASGSTSNKRY